MPVKAHREESALRLFAVPAVIALAAVFGGPAGALPATPAAARASGSLFGLACTSAKSCVAVGEDWATYDPLVEDWNGARWTASELPLPSGQYFSVLDGVSCAAPDSCIAVGSDSSDYVGVATSRSLAESWNGRSWTRIMLPNPAGGYGYELSSASCTSAENCVLTGVYTLDGSGRIAAFAEVLSGGKWRVYKLPGVVSSSYNSVIDQVACMSAASCVAVGSYGNAASPDGSPANAAVAEFWNGKKWSEVRLAPPAGSDGAWLYGVACTRSGTCVAVGGRRLANGKVTPLAETWTAAKDLWRAAFPSAAGSDPVLEGVSCVSAASCLAVGGGDQATAKTSPFALSWNGKAWKYQEFPAPLGGGKEASDAYDIACLSAANCVAVGDIGSVPEYSPNPSNYLAYGVSAFWNGKAWHLVPVA